MWEKIIGLQGPKGANNRPGEANDQISLATTRKVAQSQGRRVKWPSQQIRRSGGSPETAQSNEWVAANSFSRASTVAFNQNIWAEDGRKTAEWPAFRKSSADRVVAAVELLIIDRWK